jgi:hypothetical protein
MPQEPTRWLTTLTPTLLFISRCVLHDQQIFAGLRADDTKAVYASCFFFDIGLFLPKASITAFYWWLIPKMFRSMRFMLTLVTTYLCLAAVGAIFVDLFICRPIHYNWSLVHEEQGQSIWNSWPDFWINWTLNFSADIFREFDRSHPSRKRGSACMYHLDMIERLHRLSIVYKRQHHGRLH